MRSLVPVLVSACLGLAACARGGADTSQRVAPLASDGGRPAEVDAEVAMPARAEPVDAAAPDAGPPDAGPPPDACRATAETCDGRDQDCDGAIDEGASCPCERASLGGRTYLLCASPRSWIGAQVTCASAGYDLASIDDAAEDAAVYAAIAARGFADTWIGITDAATEMRWVDGSGAPLRYTHWDSGEPNDGGESGEDCGVIMTTRDRAAEWDDRPCASERPSVCEAP